VDKSQLISKIAVIKLFPRDLNIGSAL